MTMSSLRTTARLLSTTKSHFSLPPAALVCSAATAALVLVVAAAGQNTRLEKEGKEENGPYETPSFQIEVDFMDKLARKPYLQISGENRPEAVPYTLRLLTVDVPEVARKGFREGACRLDAEMVYPDSVAPPVIVQGEVENLDDDDDDYTMRAAKSPSSKRRKKRHQQIKVEQKAWVQDMFRCYHDGKVGVEIMESSVAKLNRKNLRRAQWLRNYVTSRQQERGAAEKEDKEQVVVVTPTLHDELEAPWNQRAWISELQQRIGGKVEFGASLEPVVRSGWWWWPWSSNHKKYDYQSTVLSSWPVYEWVLFPLYYITGRGTDPAGNDGCSGDNCWASNKPHAVIADGAALQLVPSAHRLLQKTCKENNVPLYVIRDPRVWGSNTHDSIGDVLRDLRQSLKARIVTDQLHQAAGTSFQRGRLFGKLEATAKWQAKDVARRTEEALKHAEESTRRRKEMDWSGLDEASLEQKLVRRGVILQKRGGILYSDAMTALAKRCAMGDKREGASTTRDEALKTRETPAEEDEETPAE